MRKFECLNAAGNKGFSVDGVIRILRVSWLSKSLQASQLHC